ncbi:TPA: hypothetical protein ACSTL5_005002 [Serratia fonticola]
MINYKILFSFIFSLFLSGCISAQEQLRMDREQCISYGYKHNENKIADCIKDVQLQRDKLSTEEWNNKHIPD